MLCDRPLVGSANTTLHPVDPLAHGRTTCDLVGRLTGAPWRRFLVLGDSIAEGIGDAVAGYPDVSWAQSLAVALNAAVDGLDYVNLGVRGLVASAIRDSQLEAAAAFGPDLVVLCAGGNDVLGRSFDPTALSIVLEQMVSAFAEHGALVVTFGLFDLSRTGLVPEPHRSELRRRIMALNDTMRGITERSHGVNVDFFDEPAVDMSLLSADRIHPNRRGHAHIADAVVRSLSARLTRSRRLSAPEPSRTGGPCS
jgi:lysophospholipase L1-like esterase